MRVVAAHVGLLILGVAAGLLALELCLQAVALGRRIVGWKPPQSWKATGRRVLAVGDSNTYGVLVGHDEAYPRVLADIWNAAAPAERVEILNMGYPGTNSSMLRNALPGLLDALRPDVVTIMVGVNDFWTVPEDLRDPATAGAGGIRARAARALWRWSRVYRLVHMMTRRLTLPAAPAVEVRDDRGRRTIEVGGDGIELQWKPRDKPDQFWLVALDFNLDALAEQVRRAGAVPFFVTYPGQNPAYTDASAAIRTVAARTRTPLADVHRHFERHCPWPDPCDALFPDGHPTAKGHRRVARIVMSALVQDGL